MSQISCEKPQEPRENSMSAAILNDPNEMVAQMVLPLCDEHGRERAIEKVAAACGLSYSKTYRLFYRQTTDVWSKQKKKLVEAFKRFTLDQESAYRKRAAYYAYLNEQIEISERQYGLVLPLHQGALAQCGLVDQNAAQGASALRGDTQANAAS